MKRGRENPTVVAKEVMEMTNAREISNRFTEAIGAHDANAIGALFAEDAVFSEPAGTFEGRDAIVQYWQRFFEAFPDLSVRDELKADTPDSAVNEWSATGTNAGSMETPEGTIPATGRRVTIRGCDIVTVQEGRIQAHRAYYDQLSLMEQLGLVPEGAATS